jgi:hypothetical protein
MWILKNSKDLLEYIHSRSLSYCNNFTTFDLSTLYTTIPHTELVEMEISSIKKRKVHHTCTLHSVTKESRSTDLSRDNMCDILSSVYNHYLFVILSSGQF